MPARCGVRLLMQRPFYFLTTSDGDTVEIRVGADGAQLHIHDNHTADEQDGSPAVRE